MENSLVVMGETFAAMKEQANILIKSSFLPTSINTPEKALAVAIKGHEIGMPMMWSFTHINIIQGKPTLSAEGMLGMIYKNCKTAEIVYVKSDATECVIKARRSPQYDYSTFSFTIEDAKKMGLDKKDNYVKQPGTMLQWRAVSKMGRAMFPDALCGISYTPEELGAEVNEVGEVIDVTPMKGIKSEEKKTSEKEESKEQKKQEAKKESAPPPGFDPQNPKHREFVKNYLVSKKIPHSEDDLQEVCMLMTGKPSADLKGVVDYLTSSSKDTKPDEFSIEGAPT